MGIVVANVKVCSTGVTLANAYIAVSRSSVTLVPQPTANTFSVRTVYGVWNSYPDRCDGRAPVDNSLLFMDWTSSSVSTLAPADALYADLYSAIKAKYDCHTDLDPDNEVGHHTAPTNV